MLELVTRVIRLRFVPYIILSLNNVDKL